MAYPDPKIVTVAAPTNPVNTTRPPARRSARSTAPTRPYVVILNGGQHTFNPARQDKWIFGSQETGFYLRKFAWTPIVRHRAVAGTASPDDPCLSQYWAQRRRRSRPPGMGATTLRLLRVQRGRCPLCRGLLLHADREPQHPREWEQWVTATRTAIRHHAVTVWGAGTPDERAAIRLIHAHCRRRATGGVGGTAPLHAAREPSGLA